MALRGQFAAERKELEYWRQAFEELAPELAPEVLDKIREVRMGFDSRVAAWRQEHAEELRELEERMRARREAAASGKAPGGAGGDARPADDTSGGPAGARGPMDVEAMRQLKELVASAPRVEELKKEAMALLAPAEQQRLQEILKEIRSRGERKGAPGAPGAGQAGAAKGPKPPEKGGDGRREQPEDAPDAPNRKGDGKPSGR